MVDESLKSLLQRAQQAGLELFLWNGRLAWRRDHKAPAGLKTELLSRATEIRPLLVAHYAAERRNSNAPHKWVIRLGDDPSSEKCHPAYLACGPQPWFMRMIRQATELGSESERKRWIVLEQDHVGGPVLGDDGVLVASLVKLPEGIELGGPPGSQAEILSACESCMAPPIDDDRMNEILKNETD